MKGTEPVFRSIDLIEASIQEKLTIQAIADNIHFSKYHYQRLFRDIVGESVMGYVTRRRLSLAGRELLESDASILEIALKYGYDSHEGFTRSFKAYMGVTPSQYRKYRLSAISQAIPKEKERGIMMYSKTTDAVIRELNGLIAFALETASYTEKNRATATGEIEAYAEFWDYIADRARNMAKELQANLERISDIAKHPDAIAARFLIMRTMEEAAFQSDMLAFHTGLMAARAGEKHREAFGPFCKRYEELAASTRIGADKIAAFLRELAGLIFEDMRKHAEQMLQNCVEEGRRACGLLQNFDDSYAYIKDEIQDMANELAESPLAQISLSDLEEYRFRLQVVSFAADVDAFRNPSHKELLQRVGDFDNSVSELADFFQNLSMDMAGNLAASPDGIRAVSETRKEYGDIAACGGSLLFAVRGEMQKMKKLPLFAEKEADFEALCRSLKGAVELAKNAEGQTSPEEIARAFCNVCGELAEKADGLGAYGAPMRFLAGKIMELAKRAEVLK